jgi:hypothetical protein
MGLSAVAPEIDSNYPEMGRLKSPVFPEEYTLETATGLVPELSLEKIRSRPSEDPLDLEKRATADFVTFVIGDSENPQNWPRSFRWYITLVASLLVVCIAFGSSIVTDGLGLIEEKYNVSLEVATVTCSIMVCGFAIGPLL